MRAHVWCMFSASLLQLPLRDLCVWFVCNKCESEFCVGRDKVEDIHQIDPNVEALLFYGEDGLYEDCDVSIAALVLET